MKLAEKGCTKLLDQFTELSSPKVHGHCKVAQSIFHSSATGKPEVASLSLEESLALDMLMFNLRWFHGRRALTTKRDIKEL